MTFSREVKEELAKQLPKARHCAIAELAVVLMHFGRIRDVGSAKILEISCEQEMIARKCFTLLEKTFNICVGVQKAEHLFRLVISDEEELREILSATKFCDHSEVTLGERRSVSGVLLKTECCKRAFLRCSFLCCGSVSDPGKAYHLEFVCKTPETASQIAEVLGDFSINGKIIQRKKYHVVYLKEGSAIVEFLNVSGAHVSMMNLENYRILHEIAGETNRRVNCETANLLKSVNAANAQIEDIRLIEKESGLKSLSPALYEVAVVRLEHPDATLQELGGFLDPPVGKSGVNHRLRKIQEIADKLKGEEKVERVNGT